MKVGDKLINTENKKEVMLVQVTELGIFYIYTEDGGGLVYFRTEQELLTDFRLINSEHK